MEKKAESLMELYAEEREKLSKLASSSGKGGEYLHPVLGCGDPDSRIMLIGEAPGREETEIGIPFSGKAGKQLDLLLAGSRIDRKSLFVTNAVKYRPYTLTNNGKRNRTPTGKEIAAGLSLLEREIGLIDPDWIVTLGNTPLYSIQLMLGLDRKKIGEVHGKCIGIPMNQRMTRLFPMYHPASTIYDRALAGILEKDMELFRSLIGGQEG